ncbi:unnamed protein product [Cochlearia groenlandica]
MVQTRQGKRKENPPTPDDDDMLMVHYTKNVEKTKKAREKSTEKTAASVADVALAAPVASAASAASTAPACPDDVANPLSIETFDDESSIVREKSVEPNACDVENDSEKTISDETNEEGEEVEE